MRSYWLDRKDRLFIELRESKIPKPSPTQILVRMYAAGLNRGEFLFSNSIHNGGEAKQIGLEAAGIIEELGTSVNGFKLGDRIMGRCVGAFSELILIDYREAMPIPEQLSWEQAAAIPIAYIVAFDMLVLQGCLQRNEWVLITGASSGVGVSSLQISKLTGAKVIGTSRSKDKLDKLKKLGLHFGIHINDSNFYDEVMKITKLHGADLIVNNIGGTFFSECIRSMAYEGRFATVGYLDEVLKAEINIELLHSKRLHLFGVSNRLRTIDQRAETVSAFKDHILPHFKDGTIFPIVDKTFEFDDLLSAKKMMESNQHIGKIILRGC